MKNLKVSISIFFIFSILFSCSKNVEEEIDFIEKYTLVKTSSIILPLDSTQGFYDNSFSQLKLNDGTNWLSILSKTNATIYNYDANSGDLVKKVNLELGNGPNGIGNTTVQLTHLNISKDSTFLYNGETMKMYIVNSKGEVIKSHGLIQSDDYINNGPFYISVSKDNRPYIVGNKVYINCSYLPNEYEGKKTLLSWDLRSGEMSLQGEPSDFYLEDCWGTPFSLNNFSTYDNSNRSFVLSFGVDPFVYQWKDGRLVSKKFLGSKFFLNEPYSNDISDYTSQASYRARSEHSQLSPKYYKILYLKKPKMFIRETFLERSLDEKARGVTGLKKSFIIGDSNLNRVGEYRVPSGKYHTSNFFLNDKGILMADMQHYMKNENSMKFDLYEPQIISN